MLRAGAGRAGSTGATTAGTSQGTAAPAGWHSSSSPTKSEAVPVTSRVSSAVDGSDETSVDPLHARGAGEGAHEPVIDAVEVVVVHAGEEADGLACCIVHHTDGTPEGGGEEREKGK